MNATNMSGVKVIGKADLHAKLISLQSTLDFSQVKVGPDCGGCYTIAFNIVCGHHISYRKRCQPGKLVCPGSDILTVHPEDIVLAREHCTKCRRLKTDTQRLKLNRIHKKTAAKERMREGKERWMRQLLAAELAEKNRLSRKGDAGPQAPREGQAPQVEIIDLTGE